MKKLTKLICAIFVLSFILNAHNFAFGQDEIVTNDEIKDLNNEISSKRDKLKELQDKQQQYADAIKKKQKEQATLNNQLSILEDNLAKAQLDLESAEIEIDQTNLEIKKANLEIETKSNEIEREKEHLSNIIRLIYKEDQVSTLELMLLNNSLSDFLNQMKYLEDINGEVSQSVSNLEDYQTQLEDNKKNLEAKNADLLSLINDLENKKDKIVNETDNKNYILAQSNNSESEYQRLLNRARQEQTQAENDISSLEKTVRAKISSIDSSSKLEFNDNGFIWPVTKNTITSYFHDPDYPFRYVYEHPAVDIKAKQGTQVRAAASGYVARAKDAGMGYNYIMIIHGDNLSTVYGHVTKIYVKEEDYVMQGQVIGLSGGMPGTPERGGCPPARICILK
jgi:murein DD-endopeptidase MepM/ murein hydrolase activator NlpD